MVVSSWKSVILICVTAPAIAAAGERDKPAAGPRVSVKKLNLGPAPAGAERKSLVVSPDNRRAAYVKVIDEKAVVVTDGKPSRPYDDVGLDSVTFSQDGKRIGYTARRGDQWLAVVDDVEGKPHPGRVAATLRFSPDGKRVLFVLVRAATHVVVDEIVGPGYDGIGKGTIVFSPDGKRLAFAAARAGKQFVVVDGIEQKAYDGIDSEHLAFSADGKHLAYVATLAKKQFVVHDGTEGKHYDKILPNGVGFSPDGKRFHYAAELGNKTVVVSDGQQGKLYDQVARLQFSPDGRRTAYGAIVDKQAFVVVDGVEKGPYDGLGDVGPFSPNSERLAYLINRAGKWRIVLNGKESKPWDRVLKPGVRFSPDSKRFIYLATEGKSDLVVTEDAEVRGYVGFRMLLRPFSADSRRLAFLAYRQDEKSVLVVDGQPSKAFDGFMDDQPIFSPNGKRVAVGIADEKFQRALIDGTPGKRYDRIRAPVFSPDSTSVAYQALRGDDVFLVVDQVELGPYATFYGDPKLTFDSATTLHLLAGLDKHVVRVDVTIHPEAPVASPNAPLASDKLKALVEQLVATNKRPNVGKEPLWVSKQREKKPLLPTGFDPEEQTRMVRVYQRLAETGPAAFPYLIDHLDDDRYCVTVAQISSDAALTVSVGWLCRTIIEDQLQPYGFYSRGGDELGRPRRPLYSFPATEKEALAWWEKHQHKTLAQLQLEVLDWVIAKEAEPPKDERPYSDAERQYLQALRKTLVDGGGPLAPGNASSYVIIPAREFEALK